MTATPGEITEPAPATARGRPLVIIVPGIRDRGIAWTVVKDELRQSGIAATIAGWSEYFGVFAFLVPAPVFRRAAMRRLARRIRDAIQANTVDRVPPVVSYVAHSFGSYLLCHLLRKDYHLKSDRLILCGSVLPRSFKFSGFEERFRGPVLNEVGCKDRWPFIASCVTFGYGTVGTYGYHGDPVVDRFHVSAGHGHFAEAGFASKYWVPFLKEGTIVQADKPVLESGIGASLFRVLQVIKWPVALLVTYILVGLAAGAACEHERKPVQSLNWERGALAYLNVALTTEADRVRRQNQHACANLAPLWPRSKWLPSAWPDITTIGHFDDALKRTVACGSEISTRTASQSAVDSLQLLAKAFPACVDLRQRDDGVVEILLRRDSPNVREVVIRGQASWYVCDCAPEWDQFIKRQRGGD